MTQYDLGQVVGSSGKGISSISKTGTSGLVDTYTITYSDNTTSTFTVTNGSNASVDIATSWGSTTSDSKVPSEKLTKDSINKLGNKVFYGTCTTNANVQVKEITTSSDYSLESGLILFVKFTKGNSYTSTSSNPTYFKVNNESNVAVQYVSGQYSTQTHWGDLEVVAFVYDGSNFVMVNEAVATTGQWGVTKLTDSVSSTSTSTSATPNSVKTAYDLADGKANATHYHDYTDVNNVSTVAVTVTYTDNSTETINLLKYTPPSS